MEKKDKLKILILSLFGFLILVLLAFAIFYKPANKGWEGIVPGKSSQQDIKSKFGEPEETGVLDSSVLFLKYKISEKSTFFYILNDSVLMIKTKDLSDLEKVAVNEEWKTVYSPNYRDKVIKLLPSEGIGVVVGELVSTLVEVWYFEPGSEDKVMEDVSKIHPLQKEEVQHGA